MMFGAEAGGHLGTNLVNAKVSQEFPVLSRNPQVF